jgi:hypothetical protein
MAKQRISYVPARPHGRRDAPGNGALPARRHAPPGELGDSRPCSGRVLVLRQFLERSVPQRRARPRDQGIVPSLRVARGPMRVLRQSALRQGGGKRRADRGPGDGPPQLRDLGQVQRPPKVRARLCGGDRLALADRRRLLGPPAPPFHRAGTGRARLHDRVDARAAKLAAPHQHRASRSARRHLRRDGPRFRGCRQARRNQGDGRLLGEIGPDPVAPWRLGRAERGASRGTRGRQTHYGRTTEFRFHLS